MLRCADGGDEPSRPRSSSASDSSTVVRWRGRFIAGRLAGLADEPRPGRLPSILLDQVEEVIVATLESTPGRDAHWSRASMATRTGLSKSTVGRIWKRFDLKPHLQESFKLSTDPQFVAKVVDVVGLHRNPSERAVVLCVDEEPDRGAGPLAAGAADDAAHARAPYPRLPAARDHQPVRRVIADGTVISALHRRHRAIEFKKFLVTMDKAVPRDLDVHLVCDNYAILRRLFRIAHHDSH
ncbi:IS630 family transposase [Streptomyces sp. NPDC088748]|uniref:IS630 family transposase n=1 Tax=Streptomyces sp. NPDC088748 TaxID=3365887 RepID=UPI00382406E2